MGLNPRGKQAAPWKKLTPARRKFEKWFRENYGACPVLTKTHRDLRDKEAALLDELRIVQFEKKALEEYQNQRSVAWYAWAAAKQP